MVAVKLAAAVIVGVAAAGSTEVSTEVVGAGDSTGEEQVEVDEGSEVEVEEADLEGKRLALLRAARLVLTSRKVSLLRTSPPISMRGSKTIPTKRLWPLLPRLE